jgi:hypothetical protein
VLFRYLSNRAKFLSELHIPVGFVMKQQAAQLLVALSDGMRRPVSRGMRYAPN